MITVYIQEKSLIDASNRGIDAFLDTIINAINDSIDGVLNADNMGELNGDQITLLAYKTLRDEVMDGGFVQLIHNGFGGFIFLNPFAKAVKEWGIPELARMINKCRLPFKKYHEDIERECTDEEFMAMFEKYQDFDNFDDDFVENEEEWTSKIAYYVDEHIDNFAKVIKDE